MTSRPLLLDRSVPALYWLLLAAALWILLRGHNAPGGGFIGGLVAVAASAAVAIVLGDQAARARLPLAPLPLAAGGVLLALASGLPALLAGRPYLSHFWGALPVLEVKVSTVMLFDLGVFLAVWGALTGFVLALLSARETAP
jgi:multicomponent Na+:H+ antiporter subunit B